jgi:hypothetical protein
MDARGDRALCRSGRLGAVPQAVDEAAEGGAVQAGLAQTRS